MDTISRVSGQICTTTPQQVKSAGGLITEGEAKTRLNDYFKATGINRQDPKTVFGQVFGLAQVSDFMDKIAAYNQGNQNDEIIGIRIYNAVSVRSYLPGDDGKAPLQDVLIVPVMSNGKDMYTNINHKAEAMARVANLNANDLILSDGRPCPNECDNGLDQVGS